MTLRDEYGEFIKICKLILKRNLSKNYVTLTTYRTKIIGANNTIVSYINTVYPTVNEANKTYCDNTLTKVRSKLIKCLEKLKCESTLPELNAIIGDTHVGPVSQTSDSAQDESEEEEDADQSNDNISIIQKTNSIENESEEEDKSDDNISVISLDETFITPPSVDMETPAFLRLCATTINKNFAGDPLTLNSFIDSIDLLLSLAETTALKQILFTFAKTKLEGRAREFVTADVTTITQLKATLSENIKPDNSKVIEGRMLTLKFNLGQSDQFALKVEELSDALRRTLIIEGVSATKANEISVDKTIELCRRNTQSPLIKSVLEASTFSNPKDVVAKLITQIDKTKAETQVLSFQRSNNQNGRRGHGQHQHNHRGRGNFNNYNNSNNQNQQFQQNFNRGTYNRGRGRGRGRGRFGRGNFNNGYHQNDNSQYIRTFSNQGNGLTAPVQEQIMGHPYNYQSNNHGPVITTPSEM